MSKRRLIGLAVVVLAAQVILVPRAAQAIGPVNDLFSLKKVEADPEKDYRLTEDHGPWLVMACTFSGPEAYGQAHELALELRRSYKLPAYIYGKKFEHSVGDDGRGINQFGERLPLKHLKGDKTTEVAVLVGDYPTIDDDEAQRTLDKIKRTSPECLRLDPSRPSARNLAGWRLMLGNAMGSDNKKGPMQKAFVVANPLLPTEYFAPRGLDEFVVSLNEGRPYSLLKCPGKYTVQVARFAGRMQFEQENERDLQKNRDFGSKLIEAGENAEKLAAALRVKEYEAYVFHDRCSSIVTVGSFNVVGTPRPDGRMEIHPHILQIMKIFGPEQAAGPMSRIPGGLQPKTLVGIAFDLKPVPVEVPRVSISSSYAQPLLGMNR